MPAVSLRQVTLAALGSTALALMGLCAVELGGAPLDAFGPSAAAAQGARAGQASATARLGLDTPPTVPVGIAGYALPRVQIERALREGEPRFFLPIGSSSAVLRMRVADDFAAVFRPKTRGQPHGAVAEVAVYRIAKALGMDQVPPAVPRAFPLSELSRRFTGGEGRWVAIERGLVTETSGNVEGAAIAFETTLSALHLDDAERRAAWEAALTQSTPAPTARVALYADLSRMVVLDYLIGNTGRFTNPLRGPVDGSRVVLRNHDGALAFPVQANKDARLRAQLTRTERFSRSMIAGLVALDAATLEAALAEGGAPLLDDATRATLLERRDTILSYVEAVADRYGADAALIFD
jgi:hypothetical protein